MAKAMADVNKSQKSAPTRKRNASAASSTSTPKRSVYKPNKPIVCFACQQPGHIAPNCPGSRSSSATPKVGSSSSSSSSSSSKSSKK